LCARSSLSVPICRARETADNTALIGWGRSAVRTIFESYLKVGSLTQLLTELRKRGIVTKVRTLKTGKTIGGIPFTRGSLAHLLRNRFYVGEVAFKGDILMGEQAAILDRALFDAVQARLTEQPQHRTDKIRRAAD
jgi:hypothetical protein